MFSKHDILLESQLGRNVIKKATAIYRRRLGRNDVHL